MLPPPPGALGAFPGQWLPNELLEENPRGKARRDAPAAMGDGSFAGTRDAREVPKTSSRGDFSSDDAASAGSSDGEADAPRADARRRHPRSPGRGGNLNAPGSSPPDGSQPSVGPSGPRKAGEGVEEEEQRVVDAEWLPADAQSGLPSAQLRVTLLAAGFVIGSSGASVRELSQKTRTSIQSWTEKHSRENSGGVHDGGSGGRDNQNSPSRGGSERTRDGFTKTVNNPTRVFRIRGAFADVSLAAEIIREAVARYNELCEGKRRGEFVRRAQKVRDVEFSYQPPPKTAALPNVPTGASARLTPPVAHATHHAFAQPHPVASVVAAAAMGAPHLNPMGYPGVGGVHSAAHAAASGAMFSLPVGTDPAVVAAAAQAAAAAAAAAAARAAAGVYAHGENGSFGNLTSLRGSGHLANAYGSANHLVSLANNAGFSPAASRSASAQNLHQYEHLVAQQGAHLQTSYAPQNVYQQPQHRHGGTGGLPSNGSFDRMWSGVNGGDGWSDPSTPGTGTPRAGSNAVLS